MAWPLQPSGPTVGLVMMMVTYPHPPAILPPLPAFLPLPTSSPPLLWVKVSWLGMGGALGRGPSPLVCQLFLLLLGLEYSPLPALPIFLGHHFTSSHAIKQTERSCSKLEILLQDSTNYIRNLHQTVRYQPIGRQHDSVLVKFCLVAILNI